MEVCVCAVAYRSGRWVVWWWLLPVAGFLSEYCAVMGRDDDDDKYHFCRYYHWQSGIIKTRCSTRFKMAGCARRNLLHIITSMWFAQVLCGCIYQVIFYKVSYRRVWFHHWFPLENSWRDTSTTRSRPHSRLRCGSSSARCRKRACQIFGSIRTCPP